MKLMQSYTFNEKDSDRIEQVLANIKDIVGKKLLLLINIIFNKDKQQFFESIKIREPNSDNLEHFNDLHEITERLLSYDDINELPEELIEIFGQTLLSTPELITQINKLVMKNFG